MRLNYVLELKILLRQRAAAHGTLMTKFSSRNWFWASYKAIELCIQRNQNAVRATSKYKSIALNNDATRIKNKNIDFRQARFLALKMALRPKACSERIIDKSISFVIKWRWIRKWKCKVSEVIAHYLAVALMLRLAQHYFSVLHNESLTSHARSSMPGAPASSSLSARNLIICNKTDLPFVQPCLTQSLIRLTMRRRVTTANWTRVIWGGQCSTPREAQSIFRWNLRFGESQRVETGA